MKHISVNEHVVAYGTESDGKKVDQSLHKKIGLVAGDYVFIYDYPLDREVRIQHTLTEETTPHDILLLGQTDYENIYKAEDDAVGHPGNIPGMLNRAHSDGPIGIWGHDISDLYFEGINIRRKKMEIDFDIGS